MASEENRDKTEDPGLSIGDVARATGISVHTLRVWEKRYGAPFPMKRKSGHRRYAQEEVRRLRLVRAALDEGLKPSRVVSMQAPEIIKLLSGSGAGIVGDNLSLLSDQVIQSVVAWDEKALTEIFADEWRKNGPVGFVTEKAGTILKQVGDCWESGRISVAMEHFASEILHDFLSRHWRKRNESCQGSLWVLASLPDELHNLGLQLAATIITALDQRVLFLGSSTPVDDIINTALDNEATGVAVSISSGYSGRQALRHVEKIRDSLPEETQFICGGQGAPSGIEGVRHHADIRSFYEWLQNLIFQSAM